MECFEPKKLALLRILQIFKQYSDCDHPLKQEEIAERLEKDYGIVLERKAISRNISLLKEAGYELESTHIGSYLIHHDFENSELHMLIDGILSSKHITAKHSRDLIDRICNLSNQYFKSSVKHIHTVNEWSKTDNQELFLSIELIDEAIESKRQIGYCYNKYEIDKKLHKSSYQCVSPYQMILHNQRYYLMAYSEYWRNMVFHRLDRITHMKLTNIKALPITQIPGYEDGIDYRMFSSALPYMYTDKPEYIDFIADTCIIDQIIDWFGKDVGLIATEESNKVKVSIKASPNAMEHWVMQYINYVEVIAPEHFRQRIKNTLKKGLSKYQSSL